MWNVRAKTNEMKVLCSPILKYIPNVRSDLTPESIFKLEPKSKWRFTSPSVWDGQEVWDVAPAQSVGQRMYGLTFLGSTPTMAAGADSMCACAQLAYKITWNVSIFYWKFSYLLSDKIFYHFRSLSSRTFLKSIVSPALARVSRRFGSLPVRNGIDMQRRRNV